MRINLEELKTRLEELTAPIYEEEDVELVELIVRYENRNLVLRFLSDAQGGISIDKCAKLNRTIGTLLEEQEIIDTKYYIEVSSPGLDRLLKTKRDFDRVISCSVNIKTVEGETVEGDVVKTEEDKVFVDTGDDSVAEILFSDIKKAKRIIKF